MCSDMRRLNSDDLPTVTTGEEDAGPQRAELRKAVANFDCIFLRNLRRIQMGSRPERASQLVHVLTVCSLSP